jgi:hypothetical protein
MKTVKQKAGKPGGGRASLTAQNGVDVGGTQPVYHGIVSVGQRPSARDQLSLVVTAQRLEFPHTLNALEVAKTHALCIQHATGALIHGLQNKIMGREKIVHGAPCFGRKALAPKGKGAGLCGTVCRQFIR